MHKAKDSNGVTADFDETRGIQEEGKQYKMGRVGKDKVEKIGSTNLLTVEEVITEEVDMSDEENELLEE